MKEAAEREKDLERENTEHETEREHDLAKIRASQESDTVSLTTSEG